ncbi:MAG: cysteine desulfurase [Treponema sp.]|nr:cysteine desulfurase [Treponema sp.]
MEKIDSNKRRIYFDWAASAPYSQISSAAPFGNPSSLHSEGRLAKQCLEDARKRCAAFFNVPAQLLFFTSGGTESNSIALFSTLTRPGKGRIISSLAEHASIRDGMKTLEKMGKPCGYIAVDSAGRVTPDTFSKALTQYPDTRFAAIMSVNNETGAVSDIASITSCADGNKAPVHFHCDLVQAVGKIPIDIQSWNIDSASISAHKIGGPRGIGLLYLRKPIEVFYSGGGQENGIRGGTENVQGAVSLADCLEALNDIEEQNKKAKTRWNRLITALCKIDRCTIIPKERVADDDRFSPYILQAAFNNIPGEVMARALDDLGIAVSTGSACSSSSQERPVLAAMGIGEKLRVEGIRISQGWYTTDEEIELLIDGITEVLKTL